MTTTIKKMKKMVLERRQEEARGKETVKDTTKGMERPLKKKKKKRKKAPRVG